MGVPEPGRPAPSALYILVVLGLEMMNMGLLSSHIPDTKLDFFHGSYSRASLMSGIFDGCGAFVAFLTLPVFGALSDKYGRRPFVLITVSMLAIPTVVLGLGLNLWFYFYGKLVGGVTSFGLVYAYIADVTAPSLRAKWFGYAFIAVFVPLILGPLITLGLDATWSYRMAAFAALGNVFFVAFILPESLGCAVPPDPVAENPASSDDAVSVRSASSTPPSNANYQSVGTSPRADATQGADLTVAEEDAGGVRPVSVHVVNEVDDADDLDRESTCSGSVNSPSGLSPPKLRRQVSYNPLEALKYVHKRPLMVHLTILVFFSSLAENGIIETALLFVKNHLGFTPAQNSLLLIFVAMSTIATTSLLYPALIEKFGEPFVICLGLFENFLRFIVWCFVNKAWQVYTVESTAGIAFMVFPAVGSLVSKISSPKQQGMAQGALGAVRGISTGAGPLLFSGAFSYFTSDRAPFQFPQAPFALASAFVFVAVVMAWCMPEYLSYAERKKSGLLVDEDEDETEPLTHVAAHF